MGESLKVEIERALSKLTKREAEVIRLYFGIGREHSLTLEEIGERFDLTRERVRQIKEKALRKLRHHNRRSEEHTSELQSRGHLVCRLLLEKKINTDNK